MDSSRMRTAHFSGCLYGGMSASGCMGVSASGSGGGCLPLGPGRVSASGFWDICHTHPSPPPFATPVPKQNESQTGVKTLPSFADGKNSNKG